MIGRDLSQLFVFISFVGDDGSRNIMNGKLILLNLISVCVGGFDDWI